MVNEFHCDLGAHDQNITDIYVFELRRNSRDLYKGECASKRK